MKISVWWSCAVVLLVSLSTSKATAQQCVTFQPAYSTYVSESSDGISIFTSVELDGSGTMTINRNLPGCGSIPGNPIHIPSTENIIGTTGGTSFGTPECASCYLSSQNNQSIVPTPGIDYPFTYVEQVRCSVAGTFWNTGGSATIRIAFNSGQYSNYVLSNNGQSKNCISLQLAPTA